MYRNKTAWKVSKYGIISGPYFPVVGLNTEIYLVNLRIQPKYRKIRTRNNSVFGHFSRSVRHASISETTDTITIIWNVETKSAYRTNIFPVNKPSANTLSSSIVIRTFVRSFCSYDFGSSNKKFLFLVLKSRQFY